MACLVVFVLWFFGAYILSKPYNYTFIVLDLPEKQEFYQKKFDSFFDLAYTVRYQKIGALITHIDQRNSYYSLYYFGKPEYHYPLSNHELLYFLSSYDLATLKEHPHLPIWLHPLLFHLLLFILFFTIILFKKKKPKKHQVQPTKAHKTYVGYLRRKK